MLFNFILADAQPAGAAGGMSSILMIVAIIAIFYFFMIRPQQKRAKEIKKQREAMKKGDNVVTAGGIYGKIVEVKPDSFLIQVDQNVKIRVSRESVYPSAADAQEAQVQSQNAK